MQRLFLIALVIIIFLAFVMTYQVRFTEKAIITTFGSADASSVRTEPGLGFKIPYVQSVTKYDTRARFIESLQETHNTADGSSIIVRAYMTWRVEDPLKFYRAFSTAGGSPRDHYALAERTLQSELRSAMGEISRYRFGELLASDNAASKLPELEARILANLRSQAATSAPADAKPAPAPGQIPSAPAGTAATGSLADYGITALTVGISRIGLPANTTKAVFDRMSEERAKIANAAIQQGQSIAGSLRSSAETDAAKITSFAETLASDIRRQGDAEASIWLKQMDSEPQLAVFLRNMEFFRQLNGNRTTFVIPTTMPGFATAGPDGLRGLKAGQIPAPDFSTLSSQVLGDAADAGGAVRSAPAATPAPTPAAAPSQGGRR